MKHPPFSSLPAGASGSWTRRQFLQVLALASAAVRTRSMGAPGVFLEHATRRSPWPRYQLTRPDDFLCIQAEFINLNLVHPIREDAARGAKARWQIASHHGPGYIALHFPGQHIAEQAIWDRGGQFDASPDDAKGDDAPAPATYVLWRNVAHAHEARAPDWTRPDAGLEDDLQFLQFAPWAAPKNLETSRRAHSRAYHPDWTHGMAGAWISGPSRLVFEVPQWLAPLPADPSALLALCTQLSLVVAPEVLPPAATATGQPGTSDDAGDQAPYPEPGPTRIEFPTLLSVSPYTNAQWRLRPRVNGGPQELWAFELLPAAAQGVAAPGTPRERRLGGHLFAFEARPVDNATWPQDVGPVSDDPLKPNAPKYGYYGAPKTTLYDATRQLLVHQLQEDNGDITAEHFALTALGASADLHYRPVLEPSTDQPTQKEGIQSRDGAVIAPHDQTVDPTAGLLTEWIQRTELGRDYYVKESFAGWWMPFGFKAEAVTITDRIPSMDPWARYVDGKPVKDSGSAAPTDPRALPELRDQEAHLMAFLVARKFARVKPRRPDAKLVREFGPGEAEDFMEWLGQASRSVGLSKVEIRVDRTPVLANLETPDDPGQYLGLINSGRDASVAGGTGTNAGHEIFWPRVFAYGAGAGGQRQRVPYRFPMRFTYRDGTVEDVTMPMLFVPTETLGKQLYPQAPEELRAATVSAKVAVVELPPSSSIHPGDLGDLSLLATQTGVTAGDDGTHPPGLTHLRAFLPETARLLIDPAVAPAGDGKKIALQSGALTHLADGLNLYLDGLRDEMARSIQRVAKPISDFVDRAEGGLLAAALTLDQLNDHWKAFEKVVVSLQSGYSAAQQVQSRVTGYVRAPEDAREILLTARQFIAWGAEEIGTVTPAVAAGRLEQILTLPEELHLATTVDLPAKLSQWKGTITQACTALKKALASVTDFKPALLDTLSASAQQIDPTNANAFAGALARYGTALRAVMLAWVSVFNGNWQSSDWEAVFHLLARNFDPAIEQKILRATILKRLQVRLLAGPIEAAGNQSFPLFLSPDTAGVDVPFLAGLPETMPCLREDVIDRQINDWLAGIFQRIRDDATVLAALTRGVDAAFAEERALRQRLRAFADDLAGKNPRAPGVSEQLEHDLQTLLGFALTHYRDGRARFERLLRETVTPEVFLAVRGKVLDAWRGVQDGVRNKAAAVESLAENAQRAMRQLLVTANPERARQRIEDLINLTGGQIVAAVLAEVARAAAAVIPAVAALDKLQNAFAAAIDFDEAAAAEARERRAALFAQAAAVAAAYRDSIDGMLEHSAADIAEQLKKAMLLTALPPAAGAALQQVIDLAMGESASWRLADAAVQLIGDLLARASAASQVALLVELRRQLLGKIARGEKIWTAELQAQIGSIHLLAGAVQADLQQRLDALQQCADEAGERITDLWEYCVLALVSIQHEAADQLEAYVTVLLGELAQSQLSALLTKLWPGAVATFDKVRSLIGDAPDIEQAIKKLSGDAKKQATQAVADLEANLSPLAQEVTSNLKGRLLTADGDVLALTRRALVSLPSAGMLREYQDQTRKAVFQAKQFVFSVAQAGDGLAGFLAHPSLETFHVEVPSLPDIQAVNFAADYVQSGLRTLECDLQDFRRAKGAVFAELASAANSAAANLGVAQAAARVKELSREVGAIADKVKDEIDKARAQAIEFADRLRNATEEAVNEEVGTIKRALGQEAEVISQKVSDLLPTDMPKLFGALPFSAVLAQITELASLPKLISHELPDRIERSYTWSQVVQDGNFSVLTFTRGSDQSRLQLDSRAVIYLPAPGRAVQPPSLTVRGQINDFALTVADMLTIHFQSLSFAFENGHFSCQPKLGKAAPSGGDSPTDLSNVIEFRGSLCWLEDVRKQLSSFLDGSNGFTLQASDGYIFAGLAIALPTLGFGAVCIENLSFRAALGLPTGTGPLKYRFAISDPIETFKVSVSGFAGGGFFGLELSSDPTKQAIEGAIEFGGSLSLNLVIAQGSVSVMAGIYFRRTGDSTVLSAYLRACGTVTVLGFIDVSILFLLSLHYRASSGGGSVLAGKVSLTIRVKIAFFSQTFRVHYAKEIAGSGGGQTTLNAPAWHLLHQDESLYAESQYGGRIGLPLFAGVPAGSPAPESLANQATFRPPGARPPRFSEVMSPTQWKKHRKTFRPINRGCPTDGTDARPAA